MIYYKIKNNNNFFLVFYRTILIKKNKIYKKIYVNIKQNLKNHMVELSYHLELNVYHNETNTIFQPLRYLLYYLLCFS